MKKKVRLWPKLGRLEWPGAVSVFGNGGLCNGLFAVGRAYIAKAQLEEEGCVVEMIPPTFRRFFLGDGPRHSWQLWRAGSYKSRDYAAFLPLPSFAPMGPLALLSMQVQPEVPPAEMLATEGTFIFEGMGRFFADFEGGEETVRKEVKRLLGWDSHEDAKPGTLSIHIRRSDFVALNSKNVNELGGHDYYLQTASRMRELFSIKRVKMFSDSPQDPFVKNLSKELGAELIDDPDPVRSLKLMGQSEVLIGSCSTFSAWAGFLSNTPTVFQQNYEWLDADSPGGWRRGTLATLFPDTLT